MKEKKEKKENLYSISNLFLKFNQLLWKKSFLQHIRVLFYWADGVLLLFCRGKKNGGGKKRSRRKVLIVYNMALGDGIMFCGVSQYLREIWPKEQYEITITCQSAFSSLYESTGIYDKVLPLDFSGAVVNMKKRKELFQKLREETYDIVVDPVGCEDCTTNVFVTRAARGKEKIGVLDVSMENHQAPDWLRRKVYRRVVELNQKHIHLIRYYGAFFQKLGADSCVARPAKLPHVELPFETPEKFFIIFPVASMAVKKWPPKRYAYIAEKIYEKTHMPLVLCGTEHDRAGIEEFRKLLSSDVEVADYIGKTDIMQFVELIGRASLVVSNDTSAYHIAVARQVPVAMICGGYTYHRYAKYDYEKEGCKNPLLVCRNMKCFDCNNYCRYHGFDLFPCIDRIDKKEAWKEIKALIEREGLSTDDN